MSNHQNNEQLESPTLLQSTTIDTTTYLNDLPSLTPSKPPTSISDSESDSIPERFTDEEEQQPPEDLIHSLSLNTHHHSDCSIPQPQRTPSSQTSLSALSNSHISLSEPVPIRNHRINRKRSLSALVALRYRGGKADSEIGDEERGLLALDLDTYINSGEPECIPETRALPPSALFPTLSAVIQTRGGREEVERKKIQGVKKSETRLPVIRSNTAGEKEEEIVIDLDSDGLLLPTPRSEWPFGGGTGPGKTCRGFIPGRSITPIDSILQTSSFLVQNQLSQSDVFSSPENSHTPPRSH